MDTCVYIYIYVYTHIYIYIYISVSVAHHRANVMRKSIGRAEPLDQLASGTYTPDSLQLD